MASISLLKTLIGPWETVRASLILDLQKIQRSINDLYSKLGTGSSQTLPNITVEGSIEEVGDFDLILNVTADSNVTFPTTGTLLSSTSSIPASSITGIIPLDHGGTGQDLSLTGGTTKVLAQDSSHIVSSRDLVAGDIPNLPTSILTSGQLALARGGTGVDLSGTGGAGQYLKQSSSGGTISVGTIPQSDVITASTLSRTNDTNVTLTLTGSPTISLLAATTLTLGWTGTLSTSRGGTSVDIASAALPLGSGQITYPATQNPSTNTNTLDDYTESTWTPTDQSGAGLSITDNGSFFIKIGKAVLFQFAVTYPATADGNVASISFPKAIAGTTIFVVDAINVGNNVYGVAVGGTSKSVFGANDGSQYLNSQLSGHAVFGSGWYIATA